MVVPFAFGEIAEGSMATRQTILQISRSEWWRAV